MNIANIIQHHPRNVSIQVSRHHNVWNYEAPIVPAEHLPPLNNHHRHQQHFGRAQQAPPQVNGTSHTHKQNKRKTEWCRNIVQGKICPYGSKCVYVHSKDELRKFTNPHEMANADDRIDPDTYICLPCLHHVSTGSCPMGSRCTSLHDPRLDGPTPSWLTHYEKPMNKSACAIPDPLSHYKDISRFQTNPIIGVHQWKQCGDEENAFAASYKLVCNLDLDVSIMPASQPVKKTIDEVYKLAITRDMQAKLTQSDRNFIYSNQHCLFSQPCLVLQTKYYRLHSLQTGVAIDIDDIVQEVPLHRFNSRDPMMVKADEVVFESKGKSNCNHSIWFNTEFTKSSTWMNKQKTSMKPVHLGSGSLFCMPNKNDLFKAMLFDNEPETPVMLMQSRDECSQGHKLIDSIWQHRIGWILSNRGTICTWTNNIHEVRADFDRLQKIAKRNLWPALTREQVSNIFKDTNSREEYNSTFYDPHFETEYSASLWNSFVGDMVGGRGTKPRLNVFVSMSSKDRSASKDLPHITNSSTTFISKHSKDTWEELLLGSNGPWTRALMKHSKA